MDADAGAALSSVDMIRKKGSTRYIRGTKPQAAPRRVASLSAQYVVALQIPKVIGGLHAVAVPVSCGWAGQCSVPRRRRGQALAIIVWQHWGSLFWY